MTQETDIPESIVEDEFCKATENPHLIACWVGIILNLAWFVSDYFVLPQQWLSFFIFRLSVSIIALAALFFKKALKLSIHNCVYILVVGISVQNAYMWSVMDVAHVQQHTFAFIALYIGVGMLCLWDVKYSLLIVLITLVSNVLFFKYNSQLTLGEVLINGGLLVFTVLIFMVYLIRNRYRLIYNELKSRLELNKSKQIIEEKHREVVHQKKEITDSISYARSIQRSLIPTENEFNSHFKDSFVLFQPKDIVSGDFYWVYQHNDLIFYATGDCTGHGVPGGFMTMLGISFLDDIVEVKQTFGPATILNTMRDRLITTLKQNGNFGESKDGMDITICCIDTTNAELRYSSANNSLYIVSEINGAKELNIYGADKQPCGIYEDQFPFTQHTVKLNKGDCIYTFTDGLPDQFGGPFGKKYMNKRFKETLIENSNLPMVDQKIKLHNSLSKWKGSQTQVDDILVVGVRFE